MQQRKLTPLETRALIAHANNRRRKPQLPDAISTRAAEDINRKAKASIGRPRKPINWTLAAAICARIAEGEALSAICASAGMPKASTVRDWALSNDEFGAMFERARSLGAEANAEELEQWAADRPADNVEAQWQRTRIDTRKWLLAKALPRRFGDSRTVDHSGGIALQVTTGVPMVSGVSEIVADDSEILSEIPENVIADGAPMIAETAGDDRGGGNDGANDGHNDPAMIANQSTMKGAQ